MTTVLWTFSRKLSTVNTHFSPIKCRSVKGNRRVTGKSSSFVLMSSSLFINADGKELTNQGVNFLSLSICRGPIDSREPTLVELSEYQVFIITCIFILMTIWTATRLQRKNEQPEWGKCESYDWMKKRPFLIRETYQHSPTTVEVSEKRHVRHHVTGPRGLQWEVWEDFSYDLADQTADSKQVEEDELMFCWPRKRDSAAFPGQVTFCIF